MCTCNSSEKETTKKRRARASVRCIHATHSPLLPQRFTTCKHPLAVDLSVLCIEYIKKRGKEKAENRNEVWREESSLPYLPFNFLLHFSVLALTPNKKKETENSFLSTSVFLRALFPISYYPNVLTFSMKMSTVVDTASLFCRKISFRLKPT